jgi:hypothetical protein
MTFLSIFRFKHLNLFLISCFLFLISSGFISTGMVVDDDKIYWDQNIRLKWDDFKGKPDKSQPFDASTETSVKSDLKGSGDDITITIVCFFEKSKSWVKKGKRGDTLLKHEQGHFDLAELYTRKMRKAMKEASFTSKNVNAEFKKIYLKYVGDLKKEQTRYDNETKHSIIYDKQKEWEARIAQDLKAMNAYSSSIIEIKLKG